MSGRTAVAVVLAVAAACCFAAAAVLQHGAIRRHGPARAWRSRRWWSGGIAATAGAAGHATALALAPLAVVQPLGVLAVPLGILFERRFPLRSNAVGTAGARPDGVGSSGGGTAGVTAVAWAVTGVVGGVALFTLATTAAADVPRPPVDASRVLTVVVLVALPALLLAAATARAVWSSFRCRIGHRWPFSHQNGDQPRPTGQRLPLPPGTARCLARAVPAAVAFGLVSAVLRAGIEIASRGPDASLVWLALAGVAALLAGGLGVQTAFRSGPPSLVVACLTVVDPIAAVGVGALALDERIATGPAGALAAVTGGLLAVSGVLLLARHHPEAVARKAESPERASDAAPDHPGPDHPAPDHAAPDEQEQTHPWRPRPPTPRPDQRPPRRPV